MFLPFYTGKLHVGRSWSSESCITISHFSNITSGRKQEPMWLIMVGHKSSFRAKCKTCEKGLQGIVVWVNLQCQFAQEEAEDDIPEVQIVNDSESAEASSSKSGVGNLITITGHMNCALLVASRKFNWFYPKILPLSTMRKSDFFWITKYLLIMLLCFDVTLYSKFGKRKSWCSRAGHIKCSRGPQVPHPCSK